MQLKIKPEQANMRLDKLLATYLDKSRSYISKMFDEKLIAVNFKEEKPSYITQLDDIVSYSLLVKKELGMAPKNLHLKILYEDQDVAVVYKPEGITVHPAPGCDEPTLVNGLLYQLTSLSDINGVVRPGIVHRIDKDTSGILMIAKNNKAHESLQKQLKDHTTKRIYHAIVYGEIKEDYGRIDAPIGRDPVDRIKMAVVPDGKNAVTNFKVLERLDGYTFVECRLETGRTHQIRVHFNYIGHPLVGDKVYGPKKIIDKHGQYLHAKSIAFDQPTTKERLEFDTDDPLYFKEFIEEHKKR